MIRDIDGIYPKIHPTAFVSEFAYVAGDVRIGEGSSIWPGAVVRPSDGTITIGKYTNIQDNTVIRGKDMVIGERVVIGHLVVCEAKKVSDCVLIGSGANVKEGAEIGEFSLIASGAIVPCNMNVQPMSLVVGIPARIRGKVPERHTATIESLCESYIKKTKRYKKQGNLESKEVCGLRAFD